MGFVSVDLPAPAEINKHLAAVSAVYATLGLDDDFVFPEGNERQSGSGSGDDWARLALLPGGRAVLYGMELDQAQLAWSPDQEQDALDRPEVDLAEDAPSWWMDADLSGRGHLTFLYGFDGTSWTRRDHGLDDGFGNVVFPATREAAAEAIVEALDEGCFDPADPTVQAVLSAGAEVTAEQLQALCDAAFASFFEDEPEDHDLDEYFDEEPDVEAGVARAREFCLPEGHQI